MQSFFDLVSRRESCRDYADTPVEPEKLVRCLDAARLAPSACNSQPWSFIAVNGVPLALKIGPLLQGPGMNRFALACPAFIVIVEEKESMTARMGARLKGQDFTSLDIGIAAAHLCLAATAQGLSTCMVGWFDEPKLKALLSIPAEKRVRLVVCVGYARTDAIRAKKRKSLEEVAQVR